MPDRVDEADQQLTADGHAEPVADVLARLGTTEAGLTSAEAAARAARYGPNALPPAPRRPAVLRFLGELNNTLIYVLLAAAAASALLGDWIDVGVVVAVVLINAIVGFVQESRADRAIQAVRGMLSTQASVHRDGGWRIVPAETVVPGDVVRLMPGDRVPADVRIIESFSLEVDESALTGESVPVTKTSEPVPPDAGIGDRTSMAFSGTIVTGGQARAVVTAIGGATQLGAIQSLVRTAGTTPTPLTVQLDRFARLLTAVILVVGLVMMAVGRYVHGMPWTELVPAAIGFAVAAIAEELPALVTINLALGVQQMARRRAITRRLNAVETLGAVTTICTDKTGTLTRNEMTVRELITPVARYAVSGVGYDPVGEIVGEDGGLPGDDVAAMSSVAALCTDARLIREDGAWRLVGAPTEGALLVSAMKAGTSAGAARRLDVLPFDATRKFMATVVAVPDSAPTVLVKGAPDRILERCTSQRGLRGPEPLDRDRWEREVENLAGRGLRVLAAARRPGPGADGPLRDSDVRELELLGLWGIVDPPRPEAIDAIAQCRQAGIRVAMITGDHLGTAVAIAREMGILTPGGRAMTGAELGRLPDAEFAETVADVAVFARTSPEDKLRIVRALQSRGEVVAMTGDGVNDAPALTRADIGLAMGVKGTEAAKEAADIVLADDNFATIRSAVLEGRRTFDNLRKALVFVLPTNGAESLVILAAVMFGLVLPITPVQVLWVILVTGVSLSLVLAYEPADAGVMSRPPRPPGEPLLTRRPLLYVLVVSVLMGSVTLAVFYLATGSGADVATARTQAVATLAFAQLAYLLNCRFLFGSSLTPRVLRGNRLLLWAALLLIALQAAFTYIPFLNGVFGSTPLALAEWAAPLVASALVFLIAEVFKRPLIGRPQPAAVTVASA